MKAKSISDEELVERINNGESSLIDTLMDRYIRTVYYRVGASVSLEDREDVAQDILLDVLKSLKSFKTQSTFKTWLYGLIKNKIADYHRKKARRGKALVTDDLLLEGSTVNPWPRIEAEIRVKQALAELSEDDQELILMRFCGNFSFGEMAERFNISYEALRSRYRRAIQRLTEKLGQP